MAKPLTNCFLKCRHCRGNGAGQCKDYLLHCRILKTMPDRRRYKVEVFGERFNVDSEKSRIRYVPIDKVIDPNA